MEKLIHILPKVITNEDTKWLRKIVKDPDELTRFIVEHFNTKVYLLSIISNSRYRADKLNDKINDNTSIDQLIELTKENYPENEDFVKLLDQLKNRVDCNGKSASSIIWATSLLNNLETKSADQDFINKIFFTVASTLDKSDKTIADLREELKVLTANDEKLASITNTSLVSSLVMNPNVQKTDSYYDFNTFTKIENNNDIQINSKEELFEALYSLENYNACVNYIKENYLSETDPTLDGFCENDNQRSYKALVIAVALASEIYKHDAEFDKDSNIGHNMVADIYKLRKEINNEHILAEITNKINGLEFAAGRIATQILGRELEIAKQQTRIFNLPKETFKTGNAEDFIKNDLNAFGKLIKPNLDYTLDLLNTIKALKKKYQAKTNYRKSERTEETINFLAKELNIDFIVNQELSPLDQLMQKLNILENTCDNRHKDLARMEDIYKKVKSKQKTNLDLENVEFDKKLLGKNVALKTEFHEKAIKEYFKLVELDSKWAIKGNKNETLILLSPKMILSRLKRKAEYNEKTFPILNDMFKTFKITPAELIKEITTSYYAKGDGSVNKEYEDLYKTLNDKKADKETKRSAIENADLNNKDKDTLNLLL